MMMNIPTWLRRPQGLIDFDAQFKKRDFPLPYHYPLLIK
jgi:hypothetical protein